MAPPEGMKRGGPIRHQDDRLTRVGAHVGDVLLDRGGGGRGEEDDLQAVLAGDTGENLKVVAVDRNHRLLPMQPARGGSSLTCKLKAGASLFRP